MRSGIQRMVTDGKGAYLGFVDCTCPKELLDQGECRSDCPAHNYTEDKFAHEARGIDTRQAIAERYRRGL